MSLDVYLDGEGNPYIADVTLPPVDPPPVVPGPPPTPQDLGYLSPPSPVDLQRYLGWPLLDEEQQEAAQAHLDRATTLTMAYTRGRGFLQGWMAPALRAVVLSLAARSLTNPTSASRTSAGQWASSPGLPEFTLIDRLTLDNWRRRAA